MTQKQKRAVSIGGIFVAGAFFVWLGRDGWAISTVPAHYVGYVVIALGFAGMFGINIWRGGPFDPQNDPKPGLAGDPHREGEQDK